MEVFLIRLLQFILAISLLVLLHEGGHMFFAKLFGVRVEKFYIFFDLGIGKWTGKLFSFKPKNSDTEYGVGWLPLGGYCKISGMIDESMDTEQMKQPAQPWEFRVKPAWQRLLIMIGGVTVNFIFALFLYCMIMFTWGETYVQVKDMKQGMKFNKEAKAYGFKDRDILVGTDNGTFKDFNADLFRDLSKAKRVDIIRNGKPMSINLPGDINLLNMLKSSPMFCRPFLNADVDSIIEKGPAYKIGIRKGDRLLAINGKKVDSANDFMNELSKLEDAMTGAVTRKDSIKIRTAAITWQSKANGEVHTAKTLLSNDLKLEVVFPNIMEIYKPVHIEYSLLESIPAGINYGWNVLKGYVSDMKYVASKDGAKSLGGFGSIGSLFPAEFDWYMFWKMTALLSIILAFMNILPIPALDGGHVLFLLYEMITGRKPSEKFLIWAEYIGIGALVLLMVVANLNDILRWLGYM
ncbi:MAG: RIP metalloprotease RseP [Prevotella sp.]|jgi:regulator of sigma E protease|nr:RIP metalloprotease RseP [Prevotella sp.]